MGEPTVLPAESSATVSAGVQDPISHTVPIIQLGVSSLLSFMAIDLWLL